MFATTAHELVVRPEIAIPFEPQSASDVRDPDGKFRTLIDVSVFHRGFHRHGVPCVECDCEMGHTESCLFRQMSRASYPQHCVAVPKEIKEWPNGVGAQVVAGTGKTLEELVPAQILTRLALHTTYFMRTPPWSITRYMKWLQRNGVFDARGLPTNLELDPNDRVPWHAPPTDGRVSQDQEYRNLWNTPPRVWLKERANRWPMVDYVCKTATKSLNRNVFTHYQHVFLDCATRGVVPNRDVVTELFRHVYFVDRYAESLLLRSLLDGTPRDVAFIASVPDMAVDRAAAGWTTWNAPNIQVASVRIAKIFVWVGAAILRERRRMLIAERPHVFNRARARRQQELLDFGIRNVRTVDAVDVDESRLAELDRCVESPESPSRVEDAVTSCGRIVSRTKVDAGNATTTRADLRTRLIVLRAQKSSTFEERRQAKREIRILEQRLTRASELLAEYRAKQKRAQAILKKGVTCIVGGKRRRNNAAKC